MNSTILEKSHSIESLDQISSNDIPNFSEHPWNPLWLSELRLKAFNQYKELRWPTLSEEEWRRTNLSSFPFLSFQYQPDLPRESPNHDVPDLVQPKKSWLRFENQALHSIHIDPDLEKLGVVVTTLPQGFSESDAHAHSDRYLNILRELTQHDVEHIDNRFVAMNLALWNYGALIYIPPQVQDTFPIDIVMNVHDHEHLLVPRVFIMVDHNAKAQVSFMVHSNRMHSNQDPQTMINLGINAWIGESASLTYSGYQMVNPASYNFQFEQFTLNNHATLNYQTGQFGSKLSKSRTHVILKGTGAQATMNGAYLSDAQQHFDIRTVQQHLSTNGASVMNFKGAATDRSRTIYQGLIDVSVGAQGTDAYLGSKNLILTSTARVDSIPSLNIKNNSVKCSHGSTIGKVREEEIFYLMTRGFSKQEAFHTIVQGFFEEFLSKVPIGYQEDLEQMIHAKLKNSIV